MVAMELATIRGLDASPVALYEDSGEGLAVLGVGHGDRLTRLDDLVGLSRGHCDLIPPIHLNAHHRTRNRQPPYRARLSPVW